MPPRTARSQRRPLATSPHAPLLLFFFTWSVVSAATSAAALATPPPPTIASPADFLAAWTTNVGADARVSTCLNGIISIGDASPAALFPAGFAYAWTFSSRTVQFALRLNANASLPKAEVAAAVIASIGVPAPFNQPPYLFFVWDQCALEKASGGVLRATPPTASVWIESLSADFGIEVPDATLRAIAAHGVDFSAYTSKAPSDPTYRGPCTVTCILSGWAASRAQPDPRFFPSAQVDCACSYEFWEASQGFSLLNPYRAGGSTRACMANMPRYYSFERRSPAVVRAALMQCQDVIALNTMDGALLQE
jgi:hypothetical protein